jgi:hypothetical protein
MRAIAISKAAQANEAHERIIHVLSNTVHDAIAIGKFLTEQKSTLSHGEWIPWIEANLTFDRRTATNYMRLFEKRDELKWETISHLTDAYRQLFKKASRDTSGGPAPRPQANAPEPPPASDHPPRPEPTEPATASYRGEKVILELSPTEKKAMTLALHSATPYKEAAAAWTKVLQLLRKRGVCFNGNY